MAVARPIDQALWADKMLGPAGGMKVPQVPKKPFKVNVNKGIAAVPLEDQLAIFSPERGS